MNQWDVAASSNNTNKLSPQERMVVNFFLTGGSNNTNKLSPQELNSVSTIVLPVQIIQINLVLKNSTSWSNHIRLMLAYK